MATQTEDQSSMPIELGTVRVYVLHTCIAQPQG